jgi:hypothetical protein
MRESLFERLGSYCLLVVKPGDAASKSNRDHDDNRESRKDTHGLIPLLFSVEYNISGVESVMLRPQMKLN